MDNVNRGLGKDSIGKDGINIERRLELIKMMRNEQLENIGRIRKRERILYPERKLSYQNDYTLGEHALFSERYKESYNNISDAETDINRKNDYGFYIRLGVCMALFFAFVYMEGNNISFWGISHKQIQTAIAETLDVNSFAFMEQFPYTLEE